MEINSAEFAEYPVALAAVLSNPSARSSAYLFFLLTRNVERATRARKPGTLVHLGPGNPVLARAQDEHSREGEGGITKWDTGKRARGLHRRASRGITLREQQKLTDEEKGRN